MWYYHQIYIKMQTNQNTCLNTKIFTIVLFTRAKKKSIHVISLETLGWAKSSHGFFVTSYRKTQMNVLANLT